MGWRLFNRCFLTKFCPSVCDYFLPGGDKVLREAGLLEGEKRGYFMHYDVKRDVLHELAKEIEVSAQMERKPCEPDEHGNCAAGETQHCHKKAECSDEVKEFCHGKENVEGGGHHGNCHGHKS